MIAALEIAILLSVVGRTFDEPSEAHASLSGFAKPGEPRRASAERTLEDEPPREERDPLEICFNARLIWAFTWGSASAHNTFTHFVRGEELNLRDDFGLEEGAPLIDLELAVRFSQRHRIGIRGLFGTFRASTTLDRTFEYNDNIFQAGERARTVLDIDMREGGYDYRILGGGDTTIWVGAGIRRAHLNVGLESTTLDPQGSMEDHNGIYPTLHLALGHRITPSLTLSLDLLGSPAAVPILFSRPSLGRFIETRAWAIGRITDAVALEAGVDFFWLWQDWKGREPDRHFAVNRLELFLLGPSLGFRIAF